MKGDSWAPEVVGVLRGVGADQRQAGGDEGPSLFGDVARVRLSIRHADMLPLRALGLYSAV